ncbi:hypothetical protein IZ6_27870 [Terrihabitans soli]|uniref:Uncharacterized protein n=1 Tax=Terrihabitans soli TaxID=708113 RepID=A0A6S6QXP1_9HYPH|nr:hypothetical protein [Terrihabitans soli]BCJ92052.1 hypothetical protein IZ6_27870 [Terrihabitans soli]
MPPEKNRTSHGHSADTKPTPAPSHKSYGGDKRDEVAGGPAGRGNDMTARTVNTGRDWGRGDSQEGNDGIPERAKPVANAPKEKNVFSR